LLAKNPWDITFLPVSIRKSAHSNKTVQWLSRAQEKEMSTQLLLGQVRAAQQKVWGWEKVKEW
jgi:hypothetical protein